MEHFAGAVYEGSIVRIKNTCYRWNGRVAKVLRWVHDDWYLAECDGVELMLDASRDEFDVVDSNNFPY